jgi:hypothetical protein
MATEMACSGLDSQPPCYYWPFVSELKPKQRTRRPAGCGGGVRTALFAALPLPLTSSSSGVYVEFPDCLPYPASGTPSNLPSNSAVMLAVAIESVSMSKGGYQL